MIKLTIEEKGQIFTSFCVEGHSSLGKKGNNLLCAGVSSLSQSIFLAIRDILKLELAWSKEDGYLKCVLPNSLTEKENEMVSLLIMTLIQGFEDLKRQFPREMTLDWRQDTI
ncbi:MAG: ribosomal-processing cysteine protease Prp [Spirochaetota bacterium]|nr:ribosomal-processing cysteine protease Prp [Spirochaetota bacterium]